MTIKEPESDIIYFKGNAYEDFENGSSYGSQGLNYYPLYTPGSGEKSSEEGFAEFEKNKYKGRQTQMNTMMGPNTMGLSTKTLTFSKTARI